MPINLSENSQADREAQLELTRKLIFFVSESNAIEGIHRDPTTPEIAAHTTLLSLPKLSVDSLNAFQSVVAPGNPIRDALDMHVYVGKHVAPPGGPHIVIFLRDILTIANQKEDPWIVHCQFATLHPYMYGNGR